MADLGFPAGCSVASWTAPRPAGSGCLFLPQPLDRDVDKLVTGYLNDPALHAVAPRQRARPPRRITACFVLPRLGQG